MAKPPDFFKRDADNLSGVYQLCWESIINNVGEYFDDQFLHLHMSYY